MTQALNIVAAITIFLAGIWLIGLAIAAFVTPERVKVFFGKFASTAFAHFFEMFVRLIVGAAFVLYAPQMLFTTVFTAFGWLLIVTTSVLIFVPWKLHRKFADRSLPMLYKWMTVFGVVSFGGGAFILYSLFFGATP